MLISRPIEGIESDPRKERPLLTTNINYRKPNRILSVSHIIKTHSPEPCLLGDYVSHSPMAPPVVFL